MHPRIKIPPPEIGTIIRRKAFPAGEGFFLVLDISGTKFDRDMLPYLELKTFSMRSRNIWWIKWYGVSEDIWAIVAEP